MNTPDFNNVDLNVWAFIRDIDDALMKKTQQQTGVFDAAVFSPRTWQQVAPLNWRNVGWIAEDKIVKKYFGAGPLRDRRIRYW